MLATVDPDANNTVMISPESAQQLALQRGYAIRNGIVVDDILQAEIDSLTSVSTV
jgi:hypothetical protein